MFGIDKAIINNIRIDYVDLEKLLVNDNVTYQEKSGGILVNTIDGTTKALKKIDIKDGHMFNYFMFGYRQTDNIKIGYCKLEIHISDLTDNNLNPLSISEYHNLIERVKSYILERYGISLDFAEATFINIEINKTEKMDKPFIEYEYLLDKMIYLTPKKYKIKTNYGSDRTAQQYTFYNKSVSAKVYDKTRQLREKFKIKIDHQYMRIEYTLDTTTKIKAALGTAKVYEIEDKSINEYLTTQIQKDLILPTEKHIAEANKYLDKLINEIKNSSKRNWIKDFISSAISLKMDNRTGTTDYLIDINQVMTTIKNNISSKNLNRTLQTHNDYLYKTKPYLYNNLQKLEEIKDKFL